MSRTCPLSSKSGNTGPLLAYERGGPYTLTRLNGFLGTYNRRCTLGPSLAQEEDDDFDFEQTMQEIHTELAQLNDEAVKLAEIIQSNFEELGI